MDNIHNSKKYYERIIWIQANNTNYFTYDISGMIPQDCYDLNVKLTLCYIAVPVTYNYTANLIRILCDFGVGHNQFSINNNYVQLGAISNVNIDYYYNNCLELSEPTVLPKYKLTSSPNVLTFNLTNESYVNLLTSTSNLTPSFIIICLTFSYFI